MFKQFFIIVILVLFNTIVFGQMNTGFKNPSTSSTNFSIGGVVNFIGISNIYASEDSRSTVVATVLNQITNYIVGTGFGFNIPTNAVIDGVIVEIEKSGGLITSSITDNSVKLSIGGSVTGTDMKKPGTWTTTDSYYSYGSSTNTWGIALTPTMINASDFGIAISAKLGGIGLPIAQIDHIRIVVYYSVSLPVSFRKCIASTYNDGVIVEWNTITEFNNSHFDIEYAHNGIDWIKLTQMNGAGTSTKELHYEYRDKEHTTGYYRIKQIDYNGVFSYSDIMYTVPEIILNDSNEIKLQLFLIPTLETIRIISIYEIIEFRLLNILGYDLPFDTNKLNDFVYDLKLKNGYVPEVIYIKIKDEQGNITLKSIFLIK